MMRVEHFNEGLFLQFFIAIVQFSFGVWWRGIQIYVRFLKWEGSWQFFLCFSFQQIYIHFKCESLNAFVVLIRDQTGERLWLLVIFLQWFSGCWFIFWEGGFHCREFLIFLRIVDGSGWDRRRMGFSWGYEVFFQVFCFALIYFWFVNWVTWSIHFFLAVLFRTNVAAFCIFFSFLFLLRILDFFIHFLSFNIFTQEEVCRFF